MRVKDDNKMCRVAEAAVRLFNELGFHGASMGKIAKEAGVSPATLYLYYENREDMIRKLYLAEMERMADEILKGLDKPGDSRAKLRSVWDAYYGYILSHEPGFRFSEQFTSCPCLSSGCISTTQRIFARLYDFFSEAQTKGEIRSVSSDMLYAFVFFPLAKVAKASFSGEWKPGSEDMEDLFDMTWSAVKA